MAGLQVRQHEPFFVAEEVVERRLGDAGVLEDAFDSDRLDALGVEQFVGRPKQALTCRRLGSVSGPSGRRHMWSDSNVSSMIPH